MATFNLTDEQYNNLLSILDEYETDQSYFKDGETDEEITASLDKSIEQVRELAEIIRQQGEVKNGQCD